MADKVAGNALQYIKVRFNEKFQNFFDTIMNADISNRSGDQGFTDKERPVLGPRSGTTRIGNALITTWSAGSYTAGSYVTNNGVVYKATVNTTQVPPNSEWVVVNPIMQSQQYFYTDKSGIRRHYRVFDQKLYYLNPTNDWISILDVGTNDVTYNSLRVPIMLDGSTPTERTTPAEATGSEKLKRDTGDGAAAGNFFYVGKIILITSGVYKGCYGPILSYSVTDDEYTITGSGIITKLASGSKYRIFDTVSEVLQICRGLGGNLDDIYINGITQLTYLDGYASSSLRQVVALLPNQSIKGTVVFNNQVWTYAASTLFYTGGFPGNPLFYNFIGSVTIGGNGSILDIFPYKNRLVVIGTSFIFSVRSDLSIDRHVTSYGGIRGAYVNTGDDVYIMTTQGTIISMAETINGVVTLTNIGEPVDNYVKTYKMATAFGFDSRRIYLYGQPDDVTEGTMCVFDIKRKIWTTYSGLRPRSIVSDGSRVYINDNNSDIVRVFDSTIKTDVVAGTNQTKTIAMSVSLREIDLDDIFSPKTLRNLWFAFDDKEQTVLIDVYMSNTLHTGKKETKRFRIVPEDHHSSELGLGTMGENMFGGNEGLDIIAVSQLRKIDYAADNANIFKIVITGEGGTPFYISQMDIGIAYRQDPKTYFYPGYTT